MFSRASDRSRVFPRLRLATCIAAVGHRMQVLNCLVVQNVCFVFSFFCFLLIYFDNDVIPAISLGWGRGPLLGNTTQSTRCASCGAFTAFSSLTSPGCRQGFLVTPTGPVRSCFEVLLNSPSRSGSLEITEYCTNTCEIINTL